ncbi:MAG TPA: aminoglycoside adenylyltransferase domain-containing protein [Pyrinomonadaceae bacterium]|nr:aminoglycoside adenylyltransferase domain-containing protein [Pyrinomonadaceae bacterium]
MARVPAQVSGLLKELAAGLPAVLGKNLVGVYLYGSLTQSAFDPARSDVDCLVATRRDLSDAQFRRLGAWLARLSESNPWASRLQMTLLVRDEVLTMNAKACHYQFGALRRGGSDGNPIIWLNVLESGVRLYGERPEAFVPEITPEMLSEALRREVNYLREELSLKPSSEWRDVPFYRAYAVLTLCRILYTHAKGKVVSKPRAARWAVRHLPEEWHELIRRALAADYGWLKTRAALSRICRFVDSAGARLGVSACCPSGSRRGRARR